MNEDAEAILRLRNFVAGLHEAERRAIMKHWTMAAEFRTRQVIGDVAGQLAAQIFDGSTPGVREVLHTGVSAFNSGALTAIDELLGIQPMDPLDIESEVDWLMQKFNDDLPK